MTVLLKASRLSVSTPTGRPLFRDLDIALGADRVALVGRNGVGKSSLLAVLAGVVPAQRGRVEHGSPPWLVPQAVNEEDAQTWLRHGPEAPSRLHHNWAGAVARELRWAGLAPLNALLDRPLSLGEARKVLLIRAKLARPELLLLDEPTRDLDAAGVDWLVSWLADWRGGLVVVSHNRPLLRTFDQFFVGAESGCSHFTGTLEALEDHLERDRLRAETAHSRSLRHLDAQERRHTQVNHRRQRKENTGRLRELGRCTPKSRLNKKRSQAQQNRGKDTRIRDARISGVREWARATRRAMAVALPLDLVIPVLPEPAGGPLVRLDAVGAEVDGQALFKPLSLGVHRERLGVVGPNGSGKSTLLRIMVGDQQPTTGHSEPQRTRIGVLAQGAANWMLDESLLSWLATRGGVDGPDAAAQRLVAHRFPLALADRPLRTLSPGERSRAALICMFNHRPALELLVLDEPTASLDLLGQRALREALALWPGGLVVASHDQSFLAAIGITERVEMHLGHCTRSSQMS